MKFLIKFSLEIQCKIAEAKVEMAMKDCGDNIDYRVGTVCTYTCDTKHRLVGSGMKKCQADGTWSGQDTSCECEYHFWVWF